MTNRSKDIPSQRELLLSKEKKLVAELESEATVVESNLQSTLKKLAIVGAGVLTVAILYKLVAPDTPSKKTTKKRVNATTGAPSAITASVISMALQKLLPLAIEKFSAFNSKTQKNETAAEKTSR